MPGFVGPGDLLVLLIVALLLFGPQKLPEIGRSLGKGIRSMKESIDGMHERGVEETADSRRSAPDPAEDLAAIPTARSQSGLWVGRSHDHDSIG